jgi:putative transposase
MTAGTFTQIYIQLIFAVQGRANLIIDPWREELYKYMTGIVSGKKQKLLIVNGIPDHVHLLIGMTPTIALSDLVREIKSNSSGFVNKHQWVRGQFRWQAGYGAFSYSHSQIDMVYKYIANQERHHSRKTFQEEYVDFLQKFMIPYDEQFLFDRVQ